MKIIIKIIFLFVCSISFAQFDSSYQAILDEATTQGYTLPNSADQTLQNQIIVSAKTSGIWASSDLILYFKGSGDKNFKLINWKNPTGVKATEEAYGGALTWSSTGVKGDGYALINTHFDPSVGGLNYTQNNAGGYVKVSQPNTNSHGLFGGANMSMNATILSRPRINGAGLAPIFTFPGAGLLGVSRNNATSYIVSVDSALTTLTHNSGSITSQELEVLGSGNAVTNYVRFDGEVAYVIIGGDMTDKLSDMETAFDSTSSGDTQAPTASTLSSTGQSDTTADLSWTAATDDTAVTGYKVYKGGVLEITLGNVLTYQITGLTAATAYNFMVKALDAAGNESVDSNSLNITTNNSIAGNLLDTSTWATGTGSVTGFNHYGDDVVNVREQGTSPHGSSVLLWKRAAGISSASAGGWTTDFLNIDPTKTYRYSVWAKKSNSQDGRFLFGIDVKDSSGNYSGLKTLSGGNASSYFRVGDLPTLDDWYLLVSFVHHSSYTGTTHTAGIYDVNGVKVYSTDDFKFQNEVSRINQKIFFYDQTNINDSGSFYNPAIYEVNGQEPTIQELIDGPPDTQAPTASTLSSTVQTDTTVDLSWTAATDDTAVTGYKVYKGGVLETTLGNVLIYQVTGLTAATAYNFTVKALDAAGNESVDSNTLAITTNAASDTQAPTATTLSSTSQTDTSVALSWTAATDDTAVTGYKVYKNGVLEATLGSDLLYQTTGLTAATSYNFTVTALDAAGNESVASNIIAITTNNAITGNLLDTSTWTVGSGSVTGFTRTGTDAENIREMGVGPHGTSEILWKGITDGTIVNDDGGWTTDIAIDPSKTYRCTVWMKKTNSNDGHTSFGVRAKDVSGNWALSSLDNTTQTYATYYNGPIPVLNNWYLLVGYVHNSSFSSTTSAGGLYDGLTGAKVVDLVDKKFQSTASKLINKPMLHRGTPNTADALYFYAPTIYEVNGQEPTIQELIDGPSDTQAPTASTISSTGQTDTTVDLSWTAATDNTAVTGYKVYKGGVLETTLGNELTYQVTGLTAAAAYNFTVRAIDAAGNESVDSNTLAITTNTASNFYTLQHIRASDETVMGTILDGYTLTVSDATTFNINAIPSSSVGSTEFALTGAITHNKIESSLPHALYGDQGFSDFSNGPDLSIGSYTLTVTAWSSSGGSGSQIAQDVVNFTVITSGSDTQAPTASTISSTVQTDTTVDLSWTAATDNTAVTGYKVYKGGVLETTLGNELTYQVTGLTAATAYNFTVRAIDAAGNESVDSNTLAITTNAASGGGSGNWSLNNQNVYYNAGNVGIGTTTPDEKLAVNGNIHAKEVRVDLNNWPDYVFTKAHDLPSLKEVESYIKTKGHLPNIPSAKEVEEEGIQLGEMNAKLLEKIEELTLYVLQQQQKIEKLEKRIIKQERKK